MTTKAAPDRASLTRQAVPSPPGWRSRSRSRWTSFWFLVLGLGVPACADRSLHPFFRVQPDNPRRPFLFAHRGGGGTMPEETVPTMLAAQARDLDAIIDFDVVRTRDGHIVVNHDATVDRTTNGAGNIGDLTLDEVQALDAGYCSSPGSGDGTAPREDCKRPAPGAVFPFRGMGYHISTLDEVLAALPVETFISVEVKTPGFERQFAETMRASGRLDHLVTGSEDDDVAVRLKDLLPEAAHYLPRAAATCLALTSKLALDYPGCPDYDAFASPLSGAGLALDTRGVIEAAHHRGIVVVYWTINDEPTMERLFRLGADGILTDYPERGRQVIGRLRAAGVFP